MRVTSWLREVLEGIWGLTIFGVPYRVLIIKGILLFGVYIRGPLVIVNPHLRVCPLMFSGVYVCRVQDAPPDTPNPGLRRRLSRSQTAAAFSWGSELPPAPPPPPNYLQLWGGGGGGGGRSQAS